MILNLVALFGAVVSLNAAPAEQQVVNAIKAPALSIVHLWAPWCSNCQAELKSGGWTKMVKDNPEVKFYFVSIWNSGDDGRATLAKYDLAQQPNASSCPGRHVRGGHSSERHCHR